MTSTVSRDTAIFAAVVVALGALSGVAITSQPWLVIGALVAIVAFPIMLNRPRAVFVLWLCSIAFIPYWIGVDVFGFMPIPSLLGLMVGAILISKKMWIPSGWDYILAAFIGLSLLAVVIDTSSRGTWFSMLTHWTLAFLIGRAAIPVLGKEYTGRVFAIIMSIVGGLALVEFWLSWHPFTSWAMSNGSYAAWSPIQVRGGNDRSEWAFGHSIALGGSLTLAVPFIVQGQFRTSRKILMLCLIGGGALVSLSRGGLLAVALTVALSLYALATVSSVQRFLIGCTSIFLGVWALSSFAGLTAGSSRETSSSSSYRVAMHETLIPTMQMIGRATSAQRTPSGLRFGRYQSIDSTFLILGIGFGWLVAAIAIVAFLALLVRVALRHASAPEVALVGQLPVLATVALITQYQILIWLMLGMAVTFYAMSKKDRPAKKKKSDQADFSHTGVKVPAVRR